MVRLLMMRLGRLIKRRLNWLAILLRLGIRRLSLSVISWLLVLLVLHHLRLRLVDDLAHGLLLVVHDLSHGLQPGLHHRNGRGLHDHGSLRLHDGAHDGSLGLGSSPCLILAVGLGARDVARGDFLLLALHVAKLALFASWPLSQSIGRLPRRLPQQERRSGERRDVRE